MISVLESSLKEAEGWYRLAVWLLLAYEGKPSPPAEDDRGTLITCSRRRAAAVYGRSGSATAAAAPLSD